MKVDDYLTIIIRNQCPDEPRVFGVMSDDEMTSQLREYAEMGDTEWLVLQLTPAQFRRFKCKPSEVVEIRATVAS